MSLLFKKIILLVLIILVVICPLAVVNKSAFNYRMKSGAFKLSPNINTLIAGDSHTQAALDPSILSNSINVSGSGESLFYTYYKLKYLIKSNPRVVRNVVLGFSYHNLSKKYQDEYLFNDLEFSYSMENYYQYLDYPAKKKLAFSKNSMLFLVYCLKYDFGIPLMEYKEMSTIELLFKKNVERSDISGFGGFSASDESDLNEKKVNKKIACYYLDDASNYTGSSQNIIDLLNSIATFCAENNIRLILYNSPLNVAYRRLVPTAAYDNYDKVVISLKGRYPNITLIDMSKEPLDDRFFKDGDHLNSSGAKVASRMLFERF